MSWTIANLANMLHDTENLTLGEHFQPLSSDLLSQVTYFGETKSEGI